MRLHTLTLSAIGPFPGSHTIDFATLAAGGLFLLEGPTGAGKSTIIDAVVFALYGEPASTSSSKDRLTSRHAAPGTAPVVDLVFETSAGVHRVRRGSVACQHGVHLRAASLGVIAALEDEHRGALSDREPVASAVKRATGEGRISVPLREGTHGLEPGDGKRQDAGLRAAGQHDVCAGT